MKFDKSKAFPYPVLRPYSNDYIDADFQATVDFAVDTDSVSVIVSFALSSNEIAETIRSGKAEYIVIISCRDTYFQSVLKSKENIINSTFEKGSLKGEVTVNPYIVVTKQINSFVSQDINPEFGLGPFKFDEGDILAQDDAQIFYLDKELFKPITSVFDLVKKEDLIDGLWTISFDQDHIQIQVSPKMKESIDSARNDSRNRVVLVNSIYFAAIMQAIQKIKEERDTYENRKWAQVFLSQAHNMNIDFDRDNKEAYYIAEMLLREPLKRLNELVFKGNNNES
jgi:hypothetical protein